MTYVAFLLVRALPIVCQTLSQTFGVDEAALKEDLIDFKVVPGLKQDFDDKKNDLALFWATKVQCTGSASSTARATAKILLYSVSLSTWSCDSGLSSMNDIKKALRGR